MVNFLILMKLGACHVETPFIELGQLSTLLYFFRRDPVLRTQRGRKIDSVRMNGATVPIIRSWFNLLKIPAVKDIPAAHRYIGDGDAPLGLITSLS